MEDNLDYGIIGNGMSAALVSKEGSIDWCCMPYFDSASIFGALLDPQKGGRFSIEPLGAYTIEQYYQRRTNVLVTRFDSGVDAFEVIDFMPRYKTENGTYYCPPDIIRYLHVLRGRPKVQIIYDPRPNYADCSVRVECCDGEFVKHCTTDGKYESIYLYTDLPFEKIIKRQTLELDSDHYLMTSYNQKLGPVDLDHIQLEYERTKVYWMGWVTKSNVLSNYKDAVIRSSLVLKLLAFQRTGAILAAVTTSLPETIGEVRNWDYRFCWIRDASMTISVLTRLGHYNVARRFLEFILSIVPYKDEKIQIMYGIHRQRELKEIELDWLAGYENSKPVRIGNAAYKQKQNDIYGVLMDAIYQSLRIFHNSLDNREDLWTVVRTLTRHVSNNWRKLDSGIWEFRTEKKHFTFSKILCWVAMDRAVRIAHMFGKTRDAVSYARLRDQIKANIYRNGIHRDTHALTQFYGSDSYDSANLLAEHYGFVNASDPLNINTVQETFNHLCVDGLMYRYKTPDDFGTPSSSFTVCTFWMIKSLYRIGRKEEAREMFEKVLEYSNHLGLFSEDLDFKSKRLLGNFPQGYSHLALIDTAMVLSDEPEWHSEEEAQTFVPG